MIFVAVIPLLGLFLVARGIVTLTERRSRTALAQLAAGLLAIAMFLWLLKDWNRVMIRVYEESQHRPSKAATEPATKPESDPSG